MRSDVAWSLGAGERARIALGPVADDDLVEYLGGES